MRRLFQTPELVSMICADLPSRTALVSSQFFQGMLPYMWKSASLYQIIQRSLIPTTIISDDDRTQVHFSENITKENMLRFHVYAPFVRSFALDVIPRWQFFSWGALFSYSQTRVLFPNLESIHCEFFDADALHTFLTCSTRKFSIRQLQDHPFVSRLILKTLVHTCPNIEHIEFYPDISGLDTSYFDDLVKLRCVRRLKTKDSALWLLAPLIGALPNLGALAVETSQYKDFNSVWDEPLLQPLGVGAFPVLKSLSLEFDNHDEASLFWDHLSFRCLAELSLFIKSGSLTSDGDLDFIIKLCQVNPHLETLGLYLPGYDYKGPINRYIPIPSEIIKELFCLSLSHTFALIGAQLSLSGAWSGLASTWPRLKRIICPNQLSTLDDLILLTSSLTNLEHLECDLSCKDEVSKLQHRWQPIGRPAFYPTLRMLVCRRLDLRECVLHDEHGLNSLARYFGYHWPRMRITSTNSAYHDVEHDTGYAIMFQKLIEAHVWIFHGRFPY
ncbi:hypothetical protein RhiLY_12396 [Ceratobasidium sp. AG-Ba]|nr:hypothetical protein RhiLY_12396 [Ceratobasidium sp. AG-Ba]